MVKKQKWIIISSTLIFTTVVACLAVFFWPTVKQFKENEHKINYSLLNSQIPVIHFNNNEQIIWFQNNDIDVKWQFATKKELDSFSSILKQQELFSDSFYFFKNGFEDWYQDNKYKFLHQSNQESEIKKTQDIHKILQAYYIYQFEKCQKKLIDLNKKLSIFNSSFALPIKKELKFSELNDGFKQVEHEVSQLQQMVAIKEKLLASKYGEKHNLLYYLKNIFHKLHVHKIVEIFAQFKFSNNVFNDLFFGKRKKNIEQLNKCQNLINQQQIIGKTFDDCIQVSDDFVSLNQSEFVYQQLQYQPDFVFEDNIALCYNLLPTLINTLIINKIFGLNKLLILFIYCFFYLKNYLSYYLMPFWLHTKIKSYSLINLLAKLINNDKLSSLTDNSNLVNIQSIDEMYHLTKDNLNNIQKYQEKQYQRVNSWIYWAISHLELFIATLLTSGLIKFFIYLISTLFDYCKNKFENELKIQIDDIKKLKNIDNNLLDSSSSFNNQIKIKNDISSNTSGNNIIDTSSSNKNNNIFGNNLQDSNNIFNSQNDINKKIKIKNKNIDLKTTLNLNDEDFFNPDICENTIKKNENILTSEQLKKAQEHVKKIRLDYDKTLKMMFPEAYNNVKILQNLINTNYVNPNLSFNKNGNIQGAGLPEHLKTTAKLRLKFLLNNKNNNNKFNYNDSGEDFSKYFESNC